MFHEYQYTSPPVYLCMSIPVHLYTSHTKSVSIPAHLYTSHSETQYTSPPVYQSRKYQYTSLSVYQSLSSPRYHHLMSAPYESSPLAAVVYESSPLAAVVSRCHLHVDHICPSRPGVKLGPKDHYHTALVKIPGL